MPTKPKITSDLILVFASLFIASIIWLIAKQSDLTTENISPVRIFAMNIPDNVEIKIPSEEVVIEVQYPKAQKRQVLPSKFKCVIDFRSENIEDGAGIDQPKTIQYPISIHNIQASEDLPPSIKIISIRDPKNIWIQAKLLTVTAKIKPIITGETAQGYEFKRALIEGKEEIVLTGPKSAIKSALENGKEMEILTESIDLSGKNENFLKTATLNIPAPFKPIITEQNQANINVVIEEKASRKMLEKAPVSILSLSENLIAVCTPQSVNITIEGPATYVGKIGKNSFVFNTKQAVEEKEGYAGKYAIEAKFSDTVDRGVKEKIQIIKIEPADIEIEYKPKTAN